MRLKAFVILFCCLEMGCATTGSSSRNPAATQLDTTTKSTRYSFRKIVQLKEKRTALFLVEDTESKMFTAAECTAPPVEPDKIFVEGTVCHTVIDSWVHGDDESRKNFDNHFAENIAYDNQNMKAEWTFGGTAKNMALSAFVGGSTVAISVIALEVIISAKGEGSGGGLILGLRFAKQIMTGAVILAGIAMGKLEYDDFVERSGRSIEGDLVKKSGAQLSEEDVHKVSEKIYSAVKHSLSLAVLQANSV
jgi:hypothetical protein